jgi:hypothetical protein
MPNRMRACALGWLPILMLAACSESSSTPPAAEPPPTTVTAPEPVAKAPAPPTPAAETPTPANTGDRWLLEEFDWGDSEPIVRESVDYARGFLCFDMAGKCRVVRVRVDGEDLLARFQYHEEGLWRIALITPPLSASQLSEHGPRVVDVLLGHVKRKHGEPERSEEFPDVDAVEPGTQILHHWETDDMEIDAVLVRRGSEFFVGAYFADPVRGAQAMATAIDPTEPPEKPKRARAKR